MAPHWRDLLSDEEREQFDRASWGRFVEPGTRPALLIVDMTRSMFDPQFPMAPSGGAEPVVKGCIDLVEYARSRDWPLFWTRRSQRNLPIERGSTDWKYSSADRAGGADEFIPDLCPRDDEVVIGKPRFSAFFETPLRSYLTWSQVDTVVVCGMSTSGCVRATVTDAMSANFRVFIVEQAVGDRSPSAHAANLLDMDMKFGSVIDVNRLVELFGHGGSVFLPRA